METVTGLKEGQYLIHPVQAFLPGDKAAFYAHDQGHYSKTGPTRCDNIA